MTLSRVLCAANLSFVRTSETEHSRRQFDPVNQRPRQGCEAMISSKDCVGGSVIRSNEIRRDVYNDLCSLRHFIHYCLGENSACSSSHQFQKFCLPVQTSSLRHPPAVMCFGGSRNRDEAVIIKTRVRPRPSYEEKIYISEPRRSRSSRYEYDRYERDRSVSRSRRDHSRRRSGEYYEPSGRRSSGRIVTEESRRVSRHSYH